MFNGVQRPGPDSTAGNIRFGPNFSVTNVLEIGRSITQVAAANPQGSLMGKAVAHQFPTPTISRTAPVPAGDWALLP